MATNMVRLDRALLLVAVAGHEAVAVVVTLIGVLLDVGCGLVAEHAEQPHHPLARRHGRPPQRLDQDVVAMRTWSEAVVTPRKSAPTRRTYYSWAQLMRRVFCIDVLLCDRCGGRREVLTFLTDPDVIGWILLYLGELVELPEVAPARSPSGGGWLFM